MRAGALDICARGAIDMPLMKRRDICPHAGNRYSHVKCERKRIFYIICIVKYAGVARAIFAPLAQTSIYLLSPHPPSPRRRSPFSTKLGKAERAKVGVGREATAARRLSFSTKIFSKSGEGRCVAYLSTFNSQILSCFRQGI